MDQILKPDLTIMRVLSKRKISGAAYRMIKYVVEKEVEEGHLLFNTFTKELLLLTREEYHDRLENEYLRSNWFVVPQQIDEREFVELTRSIIRSLQKNYISSYTILTTTDCNARCFYCYERGCAKVTMDEETAQKTADYIIKNCAGHKVWITWFGGEPLCNMQVIDTISKRLQEAGVPYGSKIYSNGYLFDRDAAEKAAGLWNLRSLHISLDGTETVYNKVKAYIHKDGSAYQRVLKNIEGLLAVGIGVTVRLNVDLYNADNMMELVDELTARFGGRKGIDVYVTPIYDESKPQTERYSEENLKRLYEKLQKIKDKIEAGLTYSKFSKLDVKVALSCCMADDDHATIVMPDGNLTPCNHVGEYIGHVASPERDEKLIASWKEPLEQIPECQDCVLYPNCIKLKKCTNPVACVGELRALKRRNIETGMLKELEPWKNKVL